MRLYGQGYPALSPYFKARGDCFADIFQRFFAALALADTARDRGAFSDQTPSSSRSNVVVNFIA
jgi:hypothetical protein